MSELNPVNPQKLATDFGNDLRTLLASIDKGVYPNLLKFFRLLSQLQEDVAEGGKYETIADNSIFANSIVLLNAIVSGAALTELAEARDAIKNVNESEEFAGIFDLPEDLTQ